MNKCLISILLICFGLSAQAAVPAQSKLVKEKVLFGNSFITGGVAGSGFSVLNIQNMALTGLHGERIIIDMGDMDGRPLKGFPAYYHARLQTKPARFVIDFAQTTKTQVDVKSLSERFRSSRFVAKSQMLVDPADGTMSLIFDLKSDVKVKVFQVPGKKGASKVVADLFL